MVKRIGIGLAVVFGGFYVLLNLLSYSTWHLSPRDPERIAEASAFQVALGSLAKSPEEGFAASSPGRAVESPSPTKGGVTIPNRHPDKPGRLHRVMEWPEGLGRAFNEAPMLAEQVARGSLPPVAERLPEEPLVIVPPEQNGPYGGTWTRFANGPNDVGVFEARFAYDGLVRWSPMGDSVQPNLATHWTVEDSARVFTFYLRKGVKWSDGEPFTSRDMVFWYEKVLKEPDITPVIPTEFIRGGEVMGFEALDDYTVQFRFKTPHGLFLKNMAAGRSYEMVRFAEHFFRDYHRDYVSEEKLAAMIQARGFDVWKNLWEDLHDWRSVETPRLWPWIMVDPPPARPAVFARNPYYWKVDPEGNQLPYIDRMTFDIYDPETINLKAINGEMGMQGRHLAFQNYPLFMEGREKGGYQVRHWISGSAGANVLALNLNHKDPYLHDLFHTRDFRVALSHAIDRQELNEADFFGIAKPRQVAPPPSSKFYDPDYESAYIEYDPDKARRLLDGIGLTEKNDRGMRLRPNGEPIVIRIETNSQDNRVLELVAGYWTDVGILSEIKEEARQLFYERKRGGLHDCGVWGGADEIMPVLDPRWLIPYSDESIHGVDYARWYRSNGKRGSEPPEEIKEAIELFREIERTPDEATQIELMGKILDLNRENLWVIGTLGEIPSFYLVKNDFRNVPEVAVAGWAFRTPGNTAPECYAIVPTSAPGPEGESGG